MIENSANELWIDQALRHHEFPTQGFRYWLKIHGVLLNDATEDDITDYYDDLRLTGEIPDLVEHLSNEVFFLLFNNRLLLARLNEFVAGIVSDINPSELELVCANFMAKTGVLNRVAIPAWVQRALLYRDQGRCASCSTDLSGLLSPQIDRHYDHIVPLAQHGMNDVTNIQLLCGSCNLQKGRKLLSPSNRYPTWY